MKIVYYIVVMKSPIKRTDQKRGRKENKFKSKLKGTMADRCNSFKKSATRVR